MGDYDYWADLPEKCKTSKKDRFNYIMNKINGDSSFNSGALPTQDIQEEP